MSAYYGFQKPLYSSAPVDVNRRIPDNNFKSILAQTMSDELNTPTDLYPQPQTCELPQPCKTWIQFKPELSECPASFVSWKDATDGKHIGFEIGQKDSRIWVADLDALMYRRSMVSGAIWEAESTKPHIRNRQIFAQYLQSTLYPNSSPHEKRIEGIRDSYGVLLHQYGKPQYTSF
jgi:hypothetical protein